MKKKRTAESAFLNLWILLGLLVFFSGIVLALGQRATTRRSTSENTTHLTATSRDSRRAAGALLTPEFPTGGVLWDQYDNAATEPPISIGSQDFEPAFDTLDDQAADDFVLTNPPPGINIFITGVRVMGEYSDGGGPASSFNVYLYSNAAGNLPGTLIAAFLNLAYTGTPLTLRSVCHPRSS